MALQLKQSVGCVSDTKYISNKLHSNSFNFKFIDNERKVKLDFWSYREN